MKTMKALFCGLYLLFAAALHAQGKMYWTDYGAQKIQRANLDGTSIENLFSEQLASEGIALDLVAGKMYWTNRTPAKIQRANLDGTGVEALITTGLTTPRAIALDVAAGKMYWTDDGTDKIQRANFNGAGVENLITTGLTTPWGIALDVAGGKMYWADGGTQKIQRANLNGTSVEDLIATGITFPAGIALDLAAGKMYWTAAGPDKIQRANLDGTGIEDLVVTGLTAANWIALDVAAGKMYWSDFATRKIQRANLDGTGVEDLFSFTSLFSSVWGIALDIAAGKIYWADQTGKKIQRGNLDGTGAEILLYEPTFPNALTLDPVASKIYWIDGSAGIGTIYRANFDGTSGQELVTGIYGPGGIALDRAAGKMYWTDANTIRRANLDGAGVETLVTIGTNTLTGIALDAAAGKMYWCNYNAHKIQRANLDGTGVEDLIASGLGFPAGIALDLASGKMYWANGLSPKIQRANLDGTGIEDLVSDASNAANWIALDLTAGKIYWTTVGLLSPTIRRANLDGSSVEALITTGLNTLAGIALDVTLPPTADAGADETICAGEGTTIGGSPTASGGNGGPYDITWSPATGLSSATEANPTASLAATTTYTVTVTEPSTGLSASDMVTVTVNPSPTANAGADQSLRIGQSVQIGGSPAASGGTPPYSYSWSPATGLNNASAANPNASPTSTTTYTLTVTDGSSCTASDEVTVEVKPIVFLADKDVTLDRHSASEGNIHANNDIVFKTGKPSAYKGDLTAVDDINIASKNTITGDATAGDEVDVASGSTVTGTITEDAAVAIEPLPNPSFTAGGSDVSVPQNGTVTLAPGTYDDVLVNKSGTLKLSSGNYFLDKLELKQSAKLIINVASGPVNVNVVEKLSFDKSVVVSITPTGDAGSPLVTFTQMDDDRVTIGESARVLGNVIAVEAEVRLSKNSRFKGAVVAENIVVDQGTVFLPHGSSTPLPKMFEAEESTITSEQSPVNSYQLEQNYPNPFSQIPRFAGNPSTTISFALPEAGAVSLVIYNLNGQLVRKLIAGQMNAGRHNVRWDAKDDRGQRVASGVYLYVIKAGEFTARKKLVLMK